VAETFKSFKPFSPMFSSHYKIRPHWTCSSCHLEHARDLAFSTNTKKEFSSSTRNDILETAILPLFIPASGVDVKRGFKNLNGLNYLNDLNSVTHTADARTKA